MFNTKIIISSNPKSLKDELSKYQHTATVEAEYGDITILGSVITLAHHGKHSNNLCPCLYMIDHPNVKFNLDAIGISHFDLDTLGGILYLLQINIMSSKFWRLAADIDIKGIHNVDTGELTELFDAFYAFSSVNRIYPPRDGSIQEIDIEVEKYIEFFQLLNDCEISERNSDKHNQILENGQKWRKELETLKSESFLRSTRNSKTGIGMILRSSPKFVNNLYDDLHQIIVGYNPATKRITLSKADESIPLDCDKIMKNYFGDEAGGHSGIAGTPRDKEVYLEHAEMLYDKISTIISSL
jgi:hypothetical protein